MTTSKSVHLPERDFYGSRLRCLLLTHQPPKVVAEQLTKLVQPHALVNSESDHWMPAGFSNPEEAQLHKAGDCFTAAQQQIMLEWWLAHFARTPVWDLVSTCTIDGREGLVLLEAKAHAAELTSGGKDPPRNTQNSLENHEQITAAIAESNTALNGVLPGFSLTADSHYQLCNRFAWS